MSRMSLISWAAVWGAAGVSAGEPPGPPDPPGPAAIGAVMVPITPLAHVEVRGTGPMPMILVPGLGCDWTVWDAFMTRNAERYTMYAVTLPGFGKSDPPRLGREDMAQPTAGVWLENAQQAILELYRARQLRKPVLVGHSMGAHLVARLAIDHGKLWRAAIAVDGFPAFPLQAGFNPEGEQRKVAVEQMVAGFSALSDQQWNDLIAGQMSSWVKDPERAKHHHAAVMSQPRATVMRYLGELLGSDIRADLDQLGCPLLTIVAVTDQPPPGQPIEVYEREITETLAKGGDRSSVVIFGDTRHFVMDDAPAELDAAIDAFLAGKPVPGKASSRPKVQIAAPVDEPAPQRATPTDPRKELKTTPERPK